MPRKAQRTEEIKSKGGAKTKCTPELQERFIFSYARTGVVRIACDYAGIKEATYYDWLQKAVNGLSPYAEFSEACAKAKAERAHQLVAHLDAAAAKLPNAATYLIERLYRDDFRLEVDDRTKRSRLARGLSALLAELTDDSGESEDTSNAGSD